jgi:hypothetical protein
MSNCSSNDNRKLMGSKQTLALLRQELSPVGTDPMLGPSSIAGAVDVSKKAANLSHNKERPYLLPTARTTIHVVNPKGPPPWPEHWLLS